MSVQEGEATAEVDVGRVLWMAGGNLPAFLEVDGRGVVLVDAAEYRELVAARSKLLRQALGEQDNDAKPLRLGLSTIERDEEVANFLRDRFRGGVTAEELRHACIDSFGEDRSPSTQRITRFRAAFLFKK